MSDFLTRLMMESGDNGKPAPDTPRLPIEGHLARLRDDAQRLDHLHAFREGDVVDWKMGLAIHNCGPGPYLFRRYLTPPLAQERDPSSMYYLEPNDCIVAALVPTNRSAAEKIGAAQDFVLVEWVVCSRRLEPYTGAGLANQGTA